MRHLIPRKCYVFVRVWWWEGKMLSNLSIGGASMSGSELPRSSDIDGLSVLDSRKKKEKEMEVIVIRTFEKVIAPMMEVLIRKVVKEEIQSAQQMLMTHSNGNHTHDKTPSTQSKSLRLKFLDEVSLPVLTGKEIKGKGDTAMKLAVVDNTTEHLVNFGPEASGKVEILLLQANLDENEQNWSIEDFNSKIIKESDKKKPRFTKGMYVNLKEGMGILADVKLGHDSSWMKRCLCRLGARFVDNFSRIRVKEAWTESFMVEDSRSKLYEKHYPPSLSDEVWRLKNIGKDGSRCKNLYEEKILTVQDFMFLLSIDPQRLQRIFAGSKAWKATVDHARTCIIDDKKIYLYGSSSNFNFVVAFDAVATLKGIVRDSHYVQLDNLSDVEKASARELLLLAFENREDVTSIDDETSLVQFPYESDDICVATNSECNDENVLVESHNSSQAMCLSICHLNKFGLPGSESMQYICDPSSTVPDQGLSSLPPALDSDQGLSSLPVALDSDQVSSDLLTELSNFFEDFGDNEGLISLLLHHNNNQSETCNESCSGQQSNVGSIRFFAVVAFMLWVCRVRKRVMGFGDIQAQKRQRIG